MNSYIVKTNLIIIILSSLSFASNCQSTGCRDSISFNQYFPSYFDADVSNSANGFLYTPQRDIFDNVYLSGGTSLGGPFGYWSIIKFNANNQLVWYKNYKADFIYLFKTGGAIHDIESNGNLLFSNNSNNPYTQIISKADNGGNLLWSKIIKHGTNPNLNGDARPPVLGNNGELFTTGSFADAPEMPFITALDAAGNLLWCKKYQYITVPKFHLLNNPFLVSQDINTLIMVLQYYYNADIETDPNAKFGVQLVKINKADGSIFQQQSFMYYDNAIGTTPNRAQLQKINYDVLSKRFVLAFEELGFGIHKFIFTLLDDNMNIIKTNFYSSFPNTLPLTKISISKENVISLITPVQSPLKLNYTILNNNLDIIAQKEINLSTLGFPNRNWQADMTYKKDGILNFQLSTYTTFLQDYLFLFDHSPFYNNISPCLGKDSVIYSNALIFVYPVTNPSIEEAGTAPLSITDNIPGYPPVDFPLPKTELCKAISICDTIKLSGTQFHCLSNPLDSFKIFRNPLCVRKTNWQVDTNYIKILSSTDTSLHVQYLRPYNGSIKVGFGGCSLTDEIPIEVYAAQTGVNLGNDTIHCPGKTITLRAGKNFRTYLWQDGSSKDSLVAAQPGVYNVIATDSCGNVFKDTLIVNPFDGVLQVDYPQELCKNDVAVITLPANLINYTWQPATNSSLSNYTWKLYPSSTTIYTITGERVPGCTLSDTVLVNVKNCPRYVYFPSAFTPNNDGLNDIYKPSVAGSIVFYQLTIYNRYGQTVFTSSSPNEGWNGLFNKSSKPLPGSYAWFCRYKFFNRPEQQEKGTFILIR